MPFAVGLVLTVLVYFLIVGNLPTSGMCGEIRAGREPVSVVAGDFNEDGHLDVACALHREHSVSLHFGTESDTS